MEPRMLPSKYGTAFITRDIRKTKILISITTEVQDHEESWGLDVQHTEHSHITTL